MSFEEKKFDAPGVDELLIRELKVHFKEDITDSVLSLLQTNKIKTIGQFKALTLSNIENLRAKGSQNIYKKNIIRVWAKINNMDSVKD